MSPRGSSLGGGGMADQVAEIEKMFLGGGAFFEPVFRHLATKVCGERFAVMARIAPKQDDFIIAAN